MNEVAVVNAVITRLNTDTTLTALLTGGINQLRGPIRGQSVEGNAYAVIEPSSSNKSENTQGSDGYWVTFKISVYDRQQNGIDNIYAASKRIFGNASQTAALNMVPSYGLHRHKLTLGADANGWKASVIVCDGQEFDGNDDDTVSVTIYFNVHISRTPV